MSRRAATALPDAGMDSHRLELARELRKRLGPAPRLGHAPAVSVVVVNRDGRDHLERLLPGLIDDTAYPGALELVVVDNGSTDGSVEMLETVEAPFPVRLILNGHNETFSDSCNAGARRAFGELLLFLNNDIQVLDPDWLVELVACLRRPGAGIAGSVLLHAPETVLKKAQAFSVQYRALRFRDRHGKLIPALDGYGEDPLGDRLGADASCPAVSGACMLVPRSIFAAAGGFTRAYRYGSEDIDLCLKVLRLGHGVTCAGRSVLLHSPGSTRRSGDLDAQDAERERNLRALLERWGPQLRREHDLDLLEGRGYWAQPGGRCESARPLVEAPGFCLKAEAATAPAAEAIRARFERLGRRCMVQPLGEWQAVEGLGNDVAIHLRSGARYVPKPAQFNVLWQAAEGPLPRAAECERFDLVLVRDEDEAARLADRLDVSVAVFDAERAAEDGRRLRLVTDASGREPADRLIHLVEAEMKRVGFPLRLEPSGSTAAG